MSALIPSNMASQPHTLLEGAPCLRQEVVLAPSLAWSAHHLYSLLGLLWIIAGLSCRESRDTVVQFVSYAAATVSRGWGSAPAYSRAICPHS